MTNKFDDDDWLRQSLKHTPVDDDGFTQHVMQSLPVKKQRQHATIWVNSIIGLILVLLASLFAATWGSTMDGQALRVFSAITSTEAAGLMTTALLCVAVWYSESVQ